MGVPFTVDADLDLGRSTQPWLRSAGADVYIRRGAVPTALRGVEARRSNWECAGERVLIRSGGMRFLVEGGRTIDYAAPPNTDPLDLRFFLLGTPWLALAAQRGLLPLHASAVAQGADVFAFSGPPGVGKSTLAAALSANGHALFGDDSLLLDPTGAEDAAGVDGVRCFAYKDMKLSRTGARLAGVAPGAPANSGRQGKFYVEVPRRTPQATGRLKALCLLTSRPSRDALSALKGPQAMLVLQASLHRLYLVDAIVGTQRLADWMIELAKRVDVHIFRRSMDEGHFHSSLATLASALPLPFPPPFQSFLPARIAALPAGVVNNAPTQAHARAGALESA